LVAALVAAVAGLFLVLTGSPAGAVSGSSSTSNDTSTDSASPSPSCGAVVVITSVSISPALSGGDVVVTIEHTGQDCPGAAPATLHVHQNLLASPQAGSNADHQWNKDFQIGPDFGTTVTFPLMDSADGLCFVQVDVHAGSIAKGRFFPTATCTSASSSAPESSSAPASSSAPESSSAPASSSAPESSSAPASSSVPESSSVAASSSTVSSSAPESSGVANESTTAPVAGASSGPLASTGALVSVPLLLAALMIGFGYALTRSARRRRH
jgi:hypothetical protein